jgi:prepilin-type N-terminal cleavage/methylation domain-containing protein
MSMDFSRRRSGRAGFSMAEMLIVIMLIGILAAMGAPKVSGMFRANQPKRVLDRITADISLARMRAIRSGRTAGVRATSATRYVVYVTNAAGGADTIRRVDIGSDYRNTVTVAPSNFVVVFDSRGVAKTSSSSAITASRDSRTDSLLISPVGRMYRVY